MDNLIDIKIVMKNIRTVGDLREALNNLPDDYKLLPFGSSTSCIAVDKSNKIVYLDELNWLESEFNT